MEPYVNLEELRNEILRDMYSSANPPLDFNDVLEHPEEYSDEWYKSHSLPQEEALRIFNEHVEQYNLTRREKTDLRMECLLNLGPTNTSPDIA